MTAHEFLISKRVVSLKESYSVYEIQKWLEEYVNIVLSVAAEKVDKMEVTRYDTHKNINNQYKEVILNCLKD